MGGHRAFGRGKSWLWGALIAATCARPAWAETRARLSESISLFGGEPKPALLPMTIACTAQECAAFYVDSEAGKRVGGVLLDATGAPIESTRVDLGRSSGMLRVVAADNGFVLASSVPSATYATKVVLLEPKTLSVSKDFSNLDFGNLPRTLYSNGKTALLLDVDSSNVATLIDLESGTLIGQQAIRDSWDPVVIPAPDQYLLFYPNDAGFRRLSSTTGAWLGSSGMIARGPDRSFDGSGYFRDGVFQLTWRPFDAQTGVASNQLLSMRVSAADGTLLDTDADREPAPQVLCSQCSGYLHGAFQIGAANYFWLSDGGLLKIDPTTGRRSDPTLNGPDMLAAEPVFDNISPQVEPRLLTAGGSIYVADNGDVAHLLTGEPKLPGRTSGVTSANLQVVSNGQGFLVAWNASQVLRASLVSQTAKPALGIDRISTQELGFPGLTDFKVASAAGKYLIAGLRENDDHRLDLLWRVMDGSGQLGPLNTESTSTVLTAAQLTSIALGSDGERYLLAHWVGTLDDADGTIVAQRLTAEGAIQEPLAMVVSGAVLLDGVDANFKSPEPVRRFAVTYRMLTDNGNPSFVSTTRAQGPLAFETTALHPYHGVLANDGHSLLLGGTALLDLAERPLTPRKVQSENLSGLSHWDGNTFIKFTQRGTALSVNEVSPQSFEVDGTDLQVSGELVSFGPAGAADGKGRSLLAYFASEGPEHLVALRGTLLETGAMNGAGGAGGEGGVSADAGTSGEAGAVGGPENVAGATSRGGASSTASESDGGASQPDGDAGARESDSDRRSRACGCAVPGIGPANYSVTLLLLLAFGLRRRRTSHFARRMRREDRAG